MRNKYTQRKIEGHAMYNDNKWPVAASEFFLYIIMTRMYQMPVSYARQNRRRLHSLIGRAAPQSYNSRPDFVSANL